MRPVTSSLHQCFATFWVVVLRCCIVSSDARHSKFAAHSRETYTIQHYVQALLSPNEDTLESYNVFQPSIYLNLWSKTMDATILIEYTHMHATRTDVYIYLHWAR